MHGFTREELAFLRSLNTPQKIQDFLDSIPSNKEDDGDTCMSPLRVLRENKAHCIEGAMFAAMVLRMRGHKPLILDLTANRWDYDHVVAVFRIDGCWGAISKTNHAGLGYRDPVYHTIRELVLSFFHEYLNHAGEKTLRSYTLPLDLSQFDGLGWMTDERDVWYIPEHIIKMPHIRLMTRKQERNLRKADPFAAAVSNIARDGPMALCEPVPGRRI